MILSYYAFGAYVKPSQKKLSWSDIMILMGETRFGVLANEENDNVQTKIVWGISVEMSEQEQTLFKATAEKRRVVADAFFLKVLKEASATLQASPANGIGFRAAITSLGTAELVEDLGEVVDISTLAQQGGEVVGDKTNVVPVHEVLQNPATIDFYRLHEYFLDAVELCAAKRASDSHSQLVPVVLTYDLKKMSHVSQYIWTFDHNQAECLVGVYPFGELDQVYRESGQTEGFASRFVKKLKRLLFGRGK